MTDHNIPKMVTIQEAAQITGISAYRLRIWCKDRTICAVMCGNRFLLNLDKLVEWLSDPYTDADSPHVSEPAPPTGQIRKIGA